MNFRRLGLGNTDASESEGRRIREHFHARFSNFSEFLFLEIFTVMYRFRHCELLIKTFR